MLANATEDFKKENADALEFVEKALRDGLDTVKTKIQHELDEKSRKTSVKCIS